MAVDLDERVDKEQADAANPYSDTSGAARKLREQEQQDPFDGIMNNPNVADDTQENANIAKSKNIDSAKAGEEQAGSGWKTAITGDGNKKPRSFTQKIKGAKKKSASIAIILALLGGGGLTLLPSLGGLGIVQMKEVLTEDLNDQRGAMDMRTSAMMRAKLKGVQASNSICTGVKIRCKFTTMTKRQVDNFRKAGFEVESNNKILGRERITSMSFTTKDGTKLSVKDPSDLKKLASSSLEANSALRKAFNPKYVGLSDKIALAVLAKFKTDKSNKINGDTPEEREQAITSATSGVDATISVEGFHTETDEAGNSRNFVYDESGNKVYETGEGSNASKFNEIAEKSKAGLSNIAEQAGKATPGASATGSVLKSGLKGVNVLGAADTACTVNNAARAVSAASKVARAMQLAQFAMVVFSVADQIKAGEATPEGVALIGTMLMTIDNNKTVQDESSITSANIDSDGRATVNSKAVANPYYGMGALDSPGYKTAAYNEAPTLTSRDLQYTTGGGLSGKLASVMDSISNLLGGRDNIRDRCKVVQSWWARGAGLVAGIVVGIGSFGVSTVLTVGASVAIGFALPFLEAQLADMVAGTVVSGKTAGVDAGDATFSGAGALLGGMAMAHGMKPANKTEFKQYLATTNQVRDENIAIATYDARNTPFDAMNQYSFLGSFIRTINPTAMKTSANASGVLTGIPSLLGTAMSSVMPHASADQKFNEERLSKCNDEGYRELGIDADIFCNVRFVMSDKELNMDPNLALDYMLDKKQIDPETGAAIDDSSYSNFLEHCANREDGWGETSSDDNVSDDDIGLSCMKTDDEHSFYRVYTMDYSISETMDEGLPEPTTASSGDGGEGQSSSAAPKECATMAAEDLGQIACKAYQFDDFGYLWAGGHSGTAKGFMADFNGGKYDAGSDRILDCSGLIRMATFDATGIDIGGIASGGFATSSKYKKVGKEEAKAGDVIYKPGHVELVVSNNVNDKRFKTFGAHTAKAAFPKQIGPSSWSYGDITAVYRLIKG